MSSTSPPNPALMTAEEFARRSALGHSEELVRGKAVPMPRPDPRHDQIRDKAARLFGNFLEEYDPGHVLSKGAAVITERGPDTVRRADLAFSSSTPSPKGSAHGLEVPKLVVEVVSPGERWPKVLAKVAEYLEAGVTVVLVLTDDPPQARLFRADGTVRNLGPDDELTIPDLLPEFSAPVREFFDE